MKDPWLKRSSQEVEGGGGIALPVVQLSEVPPRLENTRGAPRGRENRKRHGNFPNETFQDLEAAPQIDSDRLR